METEALCNIGPGQRRKRLLVGLPPLLIGFVGSLLSPNFIWQVLAFFGFLSIFQAQTGTCVVLAAASSRDMDDGREPVRDPELIRFFQRQSRSIYMRSFIATFVLILIARREALLNIIRSFGE